MIKKSSIEESIIKLTTIPENIKCNQIAICTIGLVGSGKTTIAKMLQDKIDLIRISTDDIRIILKYNNLNKSIEEISFELLKFFILKKYPIFLDADCILYKNKIDEVLLKHNYKAIWIHINPPENFIIKKLKNISYLNTNHPKVFNNNPQKALECYFMRKKLHKNLSSNFFHKFDTSTDDLNIQINNFIDKLNL